MLPARGKASRYNSVAIYPFTETEYAELRLESQASRVAPDRALPVSDSDNAHSVAAGVAEAKKSLPKAKVFVTDVDNSGLDQPLPHFSGTKVLLEDLKSLDVGDIEMLAFDERESTRSMRRRPSFAGPLHTRWRRW